MPPFSLRYWLCSPPKRSGSLPLSSFAVQKHSQIILCCWDHTVFWLYLGTLCFGSGSWLKNDWDSAENTHWVHPRKRKTRFVPGKKRGCFANSIPFSPSAGIQLMQSILQMATSCIWFHALQMLELCLVHHRSTVWAILPSAAGFFPADTRSHLMGDCFKTSLCSYRALPQATCRKKNMFTSTYQSTKGKQQPLEGD